MESDPIALDVLTKKFVHCTLNLMAAALPVAIVRDADHALVLLDPERRRLVEALAASSDSATGLAKRLGEKRQRLNYHLRLLESAGLVELEEERQRGGCIERIMRLTARRFVLDPAAVGELGASDPDEIGDRFSARYLVALAARAIRELAGLLVRVTAERSRCATASINTQVRLRSPADFDAFTRDLTQAVAQVVARHHDERGDGRWFRVIAGVYPGPRPTLRQQETDDVRPPGDHSA
jgi:DNA-binding transcriptional ArsR family regulator